MRGLVARIEVAGLGQRRAVDRHPSVGVAAADPVSWLPDDPLDEVVLGGRTQSDQAEQPVRRPRQATGGEG